MTRPLVTLNEASRKLSVPLGTLYSWVSTGRLTACGIGPGGKKYFRIEEVEQLAAATTRRKRQGPPDR